MDLLSLQINKEERDWSEIDSVAIIISENIGSILTFRMKGYLVILWRSKQSNTYILCMLFVIRHLIETALTYLGEVLNSHGILTLFLLNMFFQCFLMNWQSLKIVDTSNKWALVLFTADSWRTGAQPKCVAVSPV